MDRDGLITIQSRYTPKETMQRLETAVKSKGMTVFAHIDHAAGARPTDLLIFGSPKGGTPLMQSAQTIGIDLPLKALVREDAEGHVWLSYNDPAWVVQRHGGAAGMEAAAPSRQSLPRQHPPRRRNNSHSARFQCQRNPGSRNPIRSIRWRHAALCPKFGAHMLGKVSRSKT